MPDGAVSPGNPLVLSVPGHIPEEGVTVCAIGYDRESKLYYPLGWLGDDGNMQISSLPAPTASDAAITKRSFLGSIKLYFQKVIGRKLGFKGQTQRLAIPVIKDGKVDYDNHEPANVGKEVAGANRILLFVHGIIGDTEGMVKCKETIITTKGVSLQQVYDKILTFDYENLNTPIAETAVALKKCLEVVGLGAGHGKQLIIAAHSMGGLVSRFLVETPDGSKIVSKLVMLGTPNNGTPWSDVRDLVAAIFTYAINGAAFLKPWMFVLSLAGKVVKGTQETLKEMNARTGIYPQLNSGEYPGIPYIIVVGNTQSIIVRCAETTGFIQRWFQKVKERGAYDLLDELLFKKPNDIAVSDESISQIPGSDKWAMKPSVWPVACDHLNYFVTQEALEQIMIAVDPGDRPTTNSPVGV
jgi:pimeloyl-ACP methyl ester carboxylesterase